MQKALIDSYAYSSKSNMLYLLQPEVMFGNVKIYQRIHIPCLELKETTTLSNLPDAYQADKEV
jgi:hypothetical protein